jgi:hypothetical protein
MISFQDFIDTRIPLSEKLIIIGKGKKYGQIVFLAGGGGSGKGFVTSQFMEGEKFKVRDVDEWKKTFMKIADTKNMYPEIQNLNLRNPKDVFKIHQFVDKLGIKDSTMSAMLQTMQNKEVLPNIIFDVTMKNTKYMEEVIPQLISVGYEPINIHLLWVLTNYNVAVAANKMRSRIVPDDILLDTHEGAAVTINKILNGEKVINNLDGGIYIVLNNRENTIMFKTDDTKNYKNDLKKNYNDEDEKKRVTRLTNISVSDKLKSIGMFTGGDEAKAIVKDFTYLVAKVQGKPMNTSAKIKIQLYQWIVNNIPWTKKTIDEIF